MGREVRRVPADWQHPLDYGRDGKVQFRPMHKWPYDPQNDADWLAGFENWRKGLDEDGEPLSDDYKRYCYTWYAGDRPSPDNYMPQWPPEVATHYMMYEDTSEGTPISPAFATPEELARWLADTGATASYEHWLAVARGGFAPSMVLESGVMKSGVQFAGENAHSAAGDE